MLGRKKTPKTFADVVVRKTGPQARDIAHYFIIAKTVYNITLKFRPSDRVQLFNGDGNKNKIK